MNGDTWELTKGDGPLVATAIHHGHRVRPEVADIMQISEADRLREEDPYTGIWTAVAGTRIVGLVSRFEIDLNRPRNKAVYIEPEDAWGLRIWSWKPSDELLAQSLQQYDSFYAMMHAVLSDIEKRLGAFVVLDLHSYNHRRAGPTSPEADPEMNPEVNVGTGTMDRERWSSVVDRFLSDLHQFDFFGRQLDVRENVKFKGGQLSRWIHQCFPRSGCCLAIEFKKFFMDEWSGEGDPLLIDTIRQALQSTVAGLLEELKRINPCV